MRLLNSTLSLFICLIAAQVFAQDVNIPALKAEFPESEYVIDTYISTVKFKREKNKETKKEEVLVDISHEMNVQSLSGEKDVYFEHVIFTSEFSEVALVRGNYVPVGKKKKRPFTPRVENQKIERSGIFHDDMKLTYIGFHIENEVEVNQLLYRDLYNDVKFFTRMTFSGSHDVGKRTIRFEIPDWLELDFVEMNFEGVEVQKSETIDKYGNTVRSFVLENVHTFDDELPFQKGYSFSEPHLLPIAKSAILNDEKVELMASTESLYKWYNSLYQNVDNELSPDLKAKVTELTSSASSDEDKVKAIYYWVQDNIRYIAFEDGLAGFQPENCSNVFDHRYGDCKGMGNLTASMLKEAGFDASVAWIGTRNKIPYTYDIPSLAVDNHMISALFLDEEIYFLDATEKFVSFGEYAHRIQGRPVMIERGESYMLETVEDQPYTNNLVLTEVTAAIDQESGQMEFNVSKKLNGEKKRGILNYYHYSASEDVDDLTDYLLKETRDSKVADVQIQNLEDRDLPILMDYKLYMHDAVIDLGGEYYVELDYDKFFFYTDNEEDRTEDWVFDEKLNRINQVTFSLPSGYKVDHLPENLLVETDEFKVQVELKELDGKVTYLKEISVFEGEITEQNLAEWHTALSSLKEIYEDKIILSKL